MRTAIAITTIFLLLFLVEAVNASPLRKIYCNGYAKSGGEKIYYKLEGEVIKEYKKNFIIKGYSPVFKKVVTHKVLKSSCADELLDLEPKIIVKKEIIEIPPKVEKELIVEKEPEISTKSLIDSYNYEEEEKEKVRETKLVLEKKLKEEVPKKSKEYKILDYKSYLTLLIEGV